CCTTVAVIGRPRWRPCRPSSMGCGAWASPPPSWPANPSPLVRLRAICHRQACPVSTNARDRSRPRRTMTTRALDDDEGLLTEQDGADLVEMSLLMLRRWRREGTRPPCREIGGQMASGWAPIYPSQAVVRPRPRRVMARQPRGALNGDGWRP